MKTLKILSTTLLTTLMLVLVSCENNDTIAPDLSEQKVQKESEMKFNVLAIGDGAGLKKITSQSKWMDIETGGDIWLFHVGEDTLADLFVFSWLTVLPNTMSQDAEIGLTVDDQDFAGVLDVSFAPHGIEFSSPALLTLYAKGLTLTGLDPERIKFFYDNTETGEWEEMANELLYVSIEEGIILVYNAQLPHFSRYAIGYE